MRLIRPHESGAPSWVLRLYDGARVKVSINLELRDLRVGIFWRWTDFLHIYVCIVPCLPLHVVLWPYSYPRRYRMPPGDVS
jgi:hypothetical protein